MPIRDVLFLYHPPTFGGDFDESMVAGLLSHGCRVVQLRRGEPWPAQPFDLVLSYGPFNVEMGPVGYNSGILTLSHQVAACPFPQRPLSVWWLTEGMPSSRIPLAVARPLARLRVLGDRLLARQPPGSTLRRGHRLRILGELLHASANGTLDLLVVTSQRRAAYLQAQGLQPLVVPLGYHPVYGRDMALERDIDVLFLGNASAPRRRRLLPPLIEQLRNAGVHVVVEEKAYSEVRTRLLNRSRIILNVMRGPDDFVGQRFLLAGANCVLIVSETLSDSRPFLPGEHLVTAPLAQLTDTVLHYLSRPQLAAEIVERNYRFVTEQLPVADAVERILTAAEQTRKRV